MCAHRLPSRLIQRKNRTGEEKKKKKKKTTEARRFAG